MGAEKAAVADATQAAAHTQARPEVVRSTVVAAGNLQSICDPMAPDAFRAGTRRNHLA